MSRRPFETRQAQTGRRFGRRRDGAVGESLLPRTVQTNVPKKKKVMASRLRTMALCAFFLVCFAGITSRQKRGSRQRLINLRNELALISKHHSADLAGHPTAALGIPAPPKDASSSVEDTASNSGAAELTKEGNIGNTSDSSTEGASSKTELDSAGEAAVAAIGDAGSARAGTPESSHAQERTYSPMPDQIESFSRSDLLAGARPMCRIANACILANGMISLPVWMQREDRLLRRCGVGPHTYHAGSNGPKGSVVKHHDADLAQLVRLMRFKEPSATMVDFWIDSVLHAAYLFDTFSGLPKVAHQATETHCITTHSSTDCDKQLEGTAAAASVAAATAAGLKPALFVPQKIMQHENTWERGALAMLDGKYGPAATTHLFTTDVIDKEQKDKPTNVSATCFRSILVGEAKFRDLPTNAFDVTTSPLFSRSGIDRAPRSPATSNDACTISVGILKKSGARTIIPVEELRTKIASIAAAALPSATVNVEIIEPPSKDKPLSEQTPQFTNVDILLGGTSSSLANMAFMRSGGAVFEVFPFAWQPSTFGDLARVLGLRHKPVYAGPQTTDFRACMEHEVFQLRKQGRLSGDDNPEWVAAAEKRWEAAAGEFALSGRSSLLLNSDTSGVSNFHTRSCARHQNLDFNVDDVAKAILLEARTICFPSSGTA